MNKQTNAQHTPTPWHVSKGDVMFYVEASVSPYVWLEIAMCGPLKDIPQQEANAAFIVNACNAHDDLVAALKLLLSDPTQENWPTACDKARAALAKAGAA